MYLLCFLNSSCAEGKLTCASFVNDSKYEMAHFCLIFLYVSLFIMTILKSYEGSTNVVSKLNFEYMFFSYMVFPPEHHSHFSCKWVISLVLIYPILQMNATGHAFWKPMSPPGIFSSVQGVCEICHRELYGSARGKFGCSYLY